MIDLVVATKVVNITLYRGQDLDIDITLDPVIDITGYNIVFTVRRSLGLTAGPVLLTKSTGAGIIITNGPAGKFTISLLSADTTNLKFDYLYNVKSIQAGVVDPYMIGRIILKDLDVAP